MFDYASTTPSMIRTGLFRTRTFFYVWATHDGKYPLVLLAIRSNSITGTSVDTPTVVARAAGEVVPNKAIATATANSKKFAE